MILPKKHIRLTESIFGFGAFVLDVLERPMHLDDVWTRFSEINGTEKFQTYQTFDNFILTLDFLFLIGAIKVDKYSKISLCN
ncbi:MAG: hypothetical protein COA96_15005 [SAR86 cluster bacterium]|uniref:Uncharacterized protein n=1 Tax=SAR86 cluster bacterium TaxID=2030880 RepID=A0A2A5ARV0_9GAMM|nr:MAG: hypothetical protein COA96_15005 [SAR86 cluster bacterium]